MPKLSPIFANILAAHGMPQSEPQTKQCKTCKGIGSKLVPKNENEPAHDEPCEDCKGLGWVNA